MVKDDAGGAPDPEFVTLGPGFLAPDPVVLDSARVRIAAQLLVTRQSAGEVAGCPIDDIRAVSMVIEAARDGAQHPAEALDVGAGLVVLCNLRLYLDRLEADLLDAAGRVGLGWDVIAAIVGIPASAAQERHIALRARPGPR
jgi:hypothetical protein